MAIRVPDVVLDTSCSCNMPLIGLGTGGGGGSDAIKAAVLEAIKIGYRHIDTAFVYGREKAVGEAVAEALRDGVLKSREELFITSKLSCTFAEHDLVVPAIKKSLENLQMEYLDLYLVHFPLKLSPESRCRPYLDEYIQPFDVKSMWEGMEECHRLGLAKSIGVSNFSIQKLQETLQFATIIPVVNEKIIHVTAYSPLGANNIPWGDNRILSSDTLQKIAQARGKTVAQVALRWVYEQGVSFVVKSFNKQRMEENLQIFDWSLNKDDLEKISVLPQRKGLLLFQHFGTHKLLRQIDQGM